MDSVTSVPLSTRCSETIDVLVARLETVMRNKQTMIEGTARVCEEYPGEIARVHAALEERKRHVLAAATADHNAKGKDLEVSADGLLVTACQLRVCAAMCKRGIDARQYIGTMLDAASRFLTLEETVEAVSVEDVAATVA